MLATNVAETSLTIPGIIYVIDSGLARVSRYSPARQVQRLQIEPVSKASARQRAGRCGTCAKVCASACTVRRTGEDRPEFTDPEIRRSALAGALLRMKDPDCQKCRSSPPPDPPSSKSGEATALMGDQAWTSSATLTPVGAWLPIPWRLNT